MPSKNKGCRPDRNRKKQTERVKKAWAEGVKPRKSKGQKGKAQKAQKSKGKKKNEIPMSEGSSRLAFLMAGTDAYEPSRFFVRYADPCPCTENLSQTFVYEKYLFKTVWPPERMKPLLFQHWLGWADFGFWYVREIISLILSL